MEAPKIIYLPLGEVEDRAKYLVEENVETLDVKYIRADLAELTPEDIKKIEFILFKIEAAPDHPGDRTLYEEALRRFNDYKAKEQIGPIRIALGKVLDSPSDKTWLYINESFVSCSKAEGLKAGDVVEVYLKKA